MNIRNLINNNVIILDGAMGTMLQKNELETGESPELLNISKPAIIEDIHKKYIQAGSNIIYTNTFGANRKKLPEDTTVEKVISAAIKIARKAVKDTNCSIALDVGPIGQLLEPLGAISFDEAYNIFAEQILIGVKNGVDLIVIETIADLYEMKAAILAAKENSDLPIIATMTFEENHRTFMGCELPSMATIVEGLGVDALGINCSLAPNDLLPLVKELMNYTTLPVAVKANAGLPNPDGTFNTDIESFVSAYDKFIDMGVSIIGGCCGTTPEYIKRLSKYSGNFRSSNNKSIPSRICTPSKFIELNEVKIIGERLNPTGKKLMKEALKKDNLDYITAQAVEQINAGADILDINCGLPDIDETSVMLKIIKHLQSIIDTPLQIDSSNPDTIDKALRIYNGKAIVNSINGDDDVLDTVLPIVKKYGAAVIALTLDNDGIPKTMEKRIHIAEKIIRKAKQYGINQNDIFIDPLTLTVSAEQDQAKITLNTIRYINKVMGYKTVLGVSNISFGLPNRNLINSAFLMCALNNGLNLPIINPNNSDIISAVRAFKVLHGIDKECAEYISFYSDYKDENTARINEKDLNIEYCILNNLKKESSDVTKKLLEKQEPLDIINKHLIPTLDKVGKMYEEGKLFLPQLISCAETAKCGFAEINKALASTEQTTKKEKILLATVKGDVHDIGKNIVKVVLENYGYEIIDSGKNVDIGVIVNTIKEKDIKLVGLSALMTTTATNMEKTISEIRENNLDCKVMVGGAVITSRYAEKINADYYAKDANEAVKIAKQVFTSFNK